MPLYYDNSGTATFSEASRSFDTTQDWTEYEADTLQLSFHGRPMAFKEEANGHITMSGAGTNIWDSADEFQFAYKQLSGNGSIVARVDSILDTHSHAKACVMIRKTVDAGSAYAAISLTPQRGVLFTLRLRSDTASVWGDPDIPSTSSPLGTAIKAPYWIKIERTGDEVGAYYSEDGTTWEPAYGTPQPLPMDNDVLIGLGVASRYVDVSTIAEFSNISTTGTVTGSWQVKGVGIEQPNNDPAPLYVTLEDRSGEQTTVIHPDSDAVTQISWQPWNIPLTAFSSKGVDISRINRMAIGIGDPSQAPTGDKGLVYFDSIQWGHPVDISDN